MLVFLLMLHFFLFVVHCFTPNCVRENQFRNFGFPIEACSENFQDKCKFHPKGYFKSLGVVSLVKIKETTVIPTCAFYDAESLRYIYGVNSNVEVLATGAFINLPNLKSILLPFNHIREVRKDVFRNISVELLDLSWNKITYIDSTAFADVSALKYLNLSRNSLMTLSINNLANTLESINIAHNFLSTFALNSDAFLNLTSVDASNNLIHKVAISFKYPASKFDLTNNRIQNFDYMDVSSVEKFRMGKNLFEEAPQYLENINANEIDIYPNPWKCDKLMLLWETLVSFNIRPAQRKSEQNPTPECSQSIVVRLVTERRSNDCLDDHECPPFMACRARKCWDPCEGALCHKSNLCETKHHSFNCSCPAGLLADPMDLQSECKNVDCFTNNHCSDSSICLEQTCNPYDRFDEEDHDGDEDIFFGDFQIGKDELTTAQHPEKPSLDSSPTSTPLPKFTRRYSTTTNPSPPTSSTVPPSLPWWFEEIPRIIPPVSISKGEIKKGL